MATATRSMPSAGTVAGMLLRAAEDDRAQITFHLDGGDQTLSAAQLVERAMGALRRLDGLGVGPGDRVALLGRNRPEWVVWACATWLAGAALVPVQVPLRVRSPDAFGEDVARVARAAGCAVVAEPELLRFAPAGAVSWEETARGATSARAAPAPGDVAVVQFTSGSTSRPKGVVLSHGAVIAQMHALARQLDVRAGDRWLSWLPFFHDMGLFGGLLLPIFGGIAGHQLPTDRFARMPGEWLRLAGLHRATHTVAPSTAWGPALRSLRREQPPDLSAIRAAFMGAEAVDPAVLDALMDEHERLRLSPGAIGNGYGMAETVLGVSGTPLGEGMRARSVSPAALALTGRADADSGPGSRRFFSAGPPLLGTDVRVIGADGAPADAVVGDIHVRSASMMTGYLIDGALTRPFVHGGWLPTGDLGFLLDGHLYITGRSSETVIVMGHNHHPEDFEWAAEHVAGVRGGRTVAFGCQDPERVVVLVEPERDEGEPGALAARVRNAVGDVTGVRPHDVRVVGRGGIAVTTSGKRRRAAMREAYLAGELDAAGTAAS